MKDSSFSELVPMWIYEIPDLPQQVDNCFVEIKYCAGISNFDWNRMVEVHDAYVPATVANPSEGLYTITFHKIECVDGKLEYFDRVYAYDKNNLPHLFKLNGIIGFDYYKIKEGYLVNYDKQTKRFGVFEEMDPHTEKKRFVKWSSLFDDWRKVEI